MRPTESPVTLSVLDRLIDLDPRSKVEAPLTRSQSVRLLRDGVRRDLEWLLNTRRVAVPPDPLLEEVNRSVYVFGLPDFTGASRATQADVNRLIRQVQTTVRSFEPRLARIKVATIDGDTPGSRVLRFRIDGLLLMDPQPEPVSFDTVLQLTSGHYEVRDAG